jgi:hypothetical protein
MQKSPLTRRARNARIARGAPPLGPEKVHRTFLFSSLDPQGEREKKSPHPRRLRGSTPDQVGGRLSPQGGGGILIAAGHHGRLGV